MAYSVDKVGPAGVADIAGLVETALNAATINTYHETVFVRQGNGGITAFLVYE